MERENENVVIRERLARLRLSMERDGIDWYLIPTADFHGSEYVSDHFKVREYFCGFTGSNGTLLVWREGAGLWTDGRYFIQAQRELAGTGVTLYRMQEEGVPTIENFLKEHTRAGQSIGFDGRVVSAKAGKKYGELLAGKEIRFMGRQDPAEGVWEDRPALPAGEVYLLPEQIAGMTTEEKLEKVREAIRGQKAQALFLTKLDDIMWLYNIRGCDVECNPVAMSYTYVTEREAVLFIRQEALPVSVRRTLEGQGVRIGEYGETFERLEELAAGKRVLLDERYASYTAYELLRGAGEAVACKNPTERLKAVKNPAELENMRKIFLKDSVAVTKFIYWLKTHIGREEITEVSAADYLEELRRGIPEFLDLSFPTIAGYGANAAMMHYEATKEQHAVLRPEGFLLVDSGGQYMGGTTDVTRTVSLGPLTREEKLHYTAAAMGMLRMTHAKFLSGCTGRNLDILARQPIWELGLDYRCGTGHGVGYILNVHEGPHSLRWKYQPETEEAALEEGMVVTNEPGIYIEGSHGIRIENVMAVRKAEKTEYGQFLTFQTLTWAPLDRDAIDEAYLTEETRRYLEEYQREVYERISPYLTEEEREWLGRETGAAKRREM